MVRQLERLDEHNPLGAFVFLLIVALGIGGLIFRDDVAFAEFLAAVATAGGLLGVGHSVHRGAKHVDRRRTEDDR